MATTYAADTPANQAVVDSLVSQEAAFAVDLEAFLKKYAPLLAYWNSGNPQGATPSAIVNGYTAGSAVPNKSNLAGSTGVTTTNIINVMSYLTTCQGLNDTNHLDQLVPFAGPSNL